MSKKTNNKIIVKFNDPTHEFSADDMKEKEALKLVKRLFFIKGKEGYTVTVRTKNIDIVIRGNEINKIVIL